MQRWAWSVVALSCLSLAVGCTSGASTADSGTATTSGETATSSGARPANSSSVDALDLTFRLPRSFATVPDEGSTFLARSKEPQSVFSIDRDSPEVVDHDPEGGEVLTRSKIGGHDSLTIQNAVVEGLPPGVISNELLVANGSRSFSAIMSAREQDLPALWNAFIGSIQIDSD